MMAIYLLLVLPMMIKADHGSGFNPFISGQQPRITSSPPGFQPPSTPFGLDLRTTVESNRNGQLGFDPFSSSSDFVNSPPPFRTTSRPSSAPATPQGGAIDFSQATRTADGRLCVIKESQVETLTKDPILECTHKNVEKCHYTYVTQFTAAQEEICEENFEKICQITFNKQATRETIKKCYRPQRKVCNGQGPEECRTVYESSCSTRYIEKQPGKFVGDTACEKLPVEICGAGCSTEEGPEECHDKELDVLIDVPEEVCDLNPQKTCRFATKLVPKLKPKHECTVIPREVCNLKFSAPRKLNKPLRSEWCLDESPVQPGETYLEAESLSAPISTSYLPGYGRRV